MLAIQIYRFLSQVTMKSITVTTKLVNMISPRLPLEFPLLTDYQVCRIKKTLRTKATLNFLLVNYKTFRFYNNKMWDNIFALAFLRCFTPRFSIKENSVYGRPIYVGISLDAAREWLNIFYITQSNRFIVSVLKCIPSSIRTLSRNFQISLWGEIPGVCFSPYWGWRHSEGQTYEGPAPPLGES